MKPTDAQWEEIKRRFPNPTDPKNPARDKFEVFPLTVCDNTYNESHKLKLSEKFLVNVANSFDAGLPIGVSHTRDYLPIGRSLTGHYDADSGKVNIEAYLRDGVALGDGMTSADVIEAIRDGRQTDNSLELRADSYVCSICGNDLRDFGSCKHVPGQTYEDELCYATIDSGRVLNTKLVVNGSFVNAKVIPHTSEPVGSSTSVTIPFPVAAGEDVEMNAEAFIKLKEEKLRMTDKNKDTTPAATGDVTKMFAELVKNQGDMVKQLAEKDSEISQLKEKIESLEAEKKEEEKKFEEAKADMENFEAEKAEFQKAVDALKDIVKELGVQVKKDEFNEESLKEITVEKLLEMRLQYIKDLNELETGDIVPPDAPRRESGEFPASAFSLAVKKEEKDGNK